MMTIDRIRRVLLGRFAPFHLGHKMVLDYITSKFGIENCLLLIGSTNRLNSQTPYTFEERKTAITKFYPQLTILPFPDIGNDDKWLRKLKDLERRMEEEFIFYGGSKKDLDLLNQVFETHVAVNRHTKGLGISATKIRKGMTPFAVLTKS